VPGAREVVGKPPARLRRAVHGKGGIPVQFSFFDIFWLVLLFFSVLPLLKQQTLEGQRLKMIRSIEQRRSSRVITLIHRQELLNLLGLPLTRFINIEDSEQVLRAIRMTPDDMPIDVILHTPGGLVLAAGQIAMALKRHPARVTVFVPHYAMSGGTMIALAADEIVMDANAVVGPMDPQIGEYPAVSILRTVNRKEVADLDDRTLILADVAEKAVHQVRTFLQDLLSDKMEPARAEALADTLTAGTWTHDYPITCTLLEQFGLRVSCDFPDDIHRLMELYPQPAQRRPSVQYVPLPYHSSPRER
jgi:ClpP class serine protease